MLTQLLHKQKRIALIGLGYVGLPIAVEFARKMSVIGFDINEKRVQLMKNGIDPCKELTSDAFENVDILFTSNPEDLRKASFYIVAVPTPIDEYNQPDLRPLISASLTVGKVLKKGDYVVYESTVYPGCTEEDCVPVLEQESGLKCGIDFKVGYSPERINPGDTVHTLTNTTKIVSGCDTESLEIIAQVYEQVITAGVHRAPSIKVAEAGKIIENTQRDVNIALMNELSIIFNRMGINTYDVIEAAGTKWNFLKFYPGLVGGHCIGVDPYYLVHKAKQLGYHTHLIDAGRFVNDSMGGYIAKQTVKRILAADKHLSQSRVLVMGFTFKENVSDVRNTKVADIIKELQSYQVKVDLVDPYADAEEVLHEYQIEMKAQPEALSSQGESVEPLPKGAILSSQGESVEPLSKGAVLSSQGESVEPLSKGAVLSLSKGAALSQSKGAYDAIIVAVAHREYREMQETDFLKWANETCLLVDVKGLYRNKIKKLEYWSL